MKCEQQAPEQVTIHHFLSGGVYGARMVALFFKKSDQWVRDKIRSGHLSGARLDGHGPWLVSGESVRTLYGSLQLAADLTAPSTAPAESIDAVARREFARAAELNAKGKGARS